ncbi:unnamed protein product [Rotaria magnacalcarata]|nr:unnamed protein product [Rotaria magnacalcarata]CAF4067508.1 unnamed protein product [Rotaria magnacalcarata]
MLPQEEAIAILKKFLLQFNHTPVRHMTIDAIEISARIVLTENIFIYNDKYYRQIKGGAMGSPFTLTLANIFMWHWEQKLVVKQKSPNELYGRYIDDIFITSNDSIEYLRQMLSTADVYHPNIKLTSEIGKSLSFLDVQIENRNGQLVTSVHHKDSTEPYILPFKSDHPRHSFANIIRTALSRAIRYSSTLQEFKHEHRYIKLMLHYNGYPIRYIHHHFENIFSPLSIKSVSFSHMIHDENEYLTVRCQLLLPATPAEHARAARFATQADKTKSTTSIDPLVRLRLNKTQQYLDDLYPIIIHYTYENHFAYNKSTIHKL